MTVGMNESLRTNRLQLLADAMSGGRIEFYTAPRPVTGGGISAQVLVGTCTLFTPAGSVVDGVLTLNAIDQSALTTAPADLSWARFFGSASEFVADMSCGEVGSGAEIVYDDISISAGSTLRVLQGSIVEGNA